MEVSRRLFVSGAASTAAAGFTAFASPAFAAPTPSLLRTPSKRKRVSCTRRRCLLRSLIFDNKSNDKRADKPRVCIPFPNREIWFELVESKIPISSHISSKAQLPGAV